jgi:phosphate transport system substrate-binding protein
MNLPTSRLLSLSLLFPVLALLAAQPAEAGNLTASGASFPAPLYQRWFIEYNKLHPDSQINYQSIGSGAGIKQFIQGLTDFGASDAAMTDVEMGRVSAGVQLVPMTAGSIVIAYNLPGLEKPLRLARDVYPKIFLGEIKMWNDPALVASNPGVTLPDLPITIAYRADGSGTTFNFTNHLSAVSPEFKTQVGAGTLVQWPVGVGGKGNQGVAALINQTPGTLGYVEYGYAMETKLMMATLQNHDGTFVEATPESGAATLSHLHLPDNLRAFDFDPAGEDSYPMVTFTWWLCRKHNKDADVAAEIKQVAKWCLADGQKMSAELGYIPLPKPVVDRDLAALENVE